VRGNVQHHTTIKSIRQHNDVLDVLPGPIPFGATSAQTAGLPWCQGTNFRKPMC
jgi:hypothetical protein